MTPPTVRTEVVNAVASVAIKAIPSFIDLIKSSFGADDNPNQPTEAEFVAGAQQALQSSIDKDEAWKAAHPETPGQ